MLSSPLSTGLDLMFNELPIEQLKLLSSKQLIEILRDETPAHRGIGVLVSHPNDPSNSSWIRIDGTMYWVEERTAPHMSIPESWKPMCLFKISYGRSGLSEEEIDVFARLAATLNCRWTFMCAASIPSNTHWPLKNVSSFLFLNVMDVPFQVMHFLVMRAFIFGNNYSLIQGVEPKPFVTTNES